MAVLGEPRRHRILIGKPGLDGHNRGVHVLVRALRDAGLEVIYTGIRKTPEQIVEAAIQEDVDAVGVSSLSGAHMTLFPEIAERLRREAPDVLLFCGGIIPEDDRAALEKCGYKGIFGPGTSTEDIVKWLRAELGGTTLRASETGVTALDPQPPGGPREPPG